MDGNNNQSNGVSQDDLNKAFVATSENSGVVQQNVENIEKGVGVEQKSSKVPIIIVSIIAIVMAVVATVFAYLYFTNLSSNSGDGGTDKEQSSEKQSDDSNNGDGSGDVSRSEANIIEELKEKVGIILGKINDDNTIKVGRSIQNDDLELFTKGDLPDAVGIASIILRSSELETIALSDDQIDKINGYYSENYVNKVAFDKNLREFLEENRSDGGFYGDDIAKIYHDIFGQDVIHQDIVYCPIYFNYYQELNIYYKLRGGCGGWTDYNRQYYVYDYDVSDDNAYVYIAAASSNGEGELMCDVYTYDELNSGESINVCGSVSDPEDLINSSNYQNFAKYRFVFNNADDGTYYFVKVEKL